MKYTKFILTCSILTILQGCVAAAVVSVVGGATVVADKRTIGQQIDDQTIEINAYAKLYQNEALKEQSNLQVTSVNGTVLVVGQAPSQHLKDTAANILASINGVQKIHNQIRISNNASITTTSHDVWLTSRVKTAFLSSDNLEPTNIKVVTENGEVFLMGLITHAHANEAVEIARNISGVNRVFKAFEYLD